MFKASLQYLLPLMMIAAIVICGCTRSDKSGETSIGIIGPPEGLANTNVKAIEQDGQGQVWVGTEDGLFHLTGDRCS